jgi:type I restriction-modification system DNA methylase subunit
VFNPYTGIRTNLLFFTKGEPTKDVWYYEHPYPPGAKSYNKGKPIRIEEFEAERAWWESILTLAVQGKLVPQDPNDEPAEVLLSMMRTSKRFRLYVSVVTSIFLLRNLVVPSFLAIETYTTRKPGVLIRVSGAEY